MSLPFHTYMCGAYMPPFPHVSFLTCVFPSLWIRLLLAFNIPSPSSLPIVQVSTLLTPMLANGHWHLMSYESRALERQSLCLMYTWSPGFFTQHSSMVWTPLNLWRSSSSEQSHTSSHLSQCVQFLSPSAKYPKVM